MPMLGTVNPLPQRQGVKTRQIYYPGEASPGVDPVTPIGYVMDLLEENPFGTESNLTRVPVFKGKRKSDSVIKGNKNAEGETPYGIDFRVFPRIIKQFVGTGGYLRPGGGTTKLHRMFTPDDITSVLQSNQLQDESLESPVQYLRNKGVYPGRITLSYASEGVARYGVNWMGIGREVKTSLAGTIVEYPFRAASYFNGYAKLAGYYLVGLTEFSLNFDTALTRQEAAFHEGEAGSIGYGQVNADGRLGLMFSTTGAAPENNMNFYDYAVNEMNISLDVSWSNAPVDIADSWCRIVIPTVRFSQRGFRAGGNMGKVITQNFQMVNEADSDHPAEIMGEIRGPYNTSVNNIIAIKYNGGANISITLPTGAATTLTDIVSAINANGTFNANSVALEYYGRLMLRTNGKGSTFSLQIDTSVANSAHAALGLDSIARTGINDTDFIFEFFNDIATDL